MTVSAGFIETITEQVAPLGHITVRKMFGGAAVYCGGQVFALIDDDVLYFKVDDQTRSAFEAETCGPFTYQTKAGQHIMAAYHRVPDRLLDEPDELLDWARRALSVGQRAVKAKPKSRRAKVKA
jgi:DNA transformation protein and related proteins